MVMRCDVTRGKSFIAYGGGRRVGEAINVQNPKRLQPSQLPSRKSAFAHEPAAQPIVTVPGFAPAAWVYHCPRTIHLTALHDRAIRGETDAPIHGVAGQDDESAHAAEIAFDTIIGTG